MKPILAFLTALLLVPLAALAAPERPNVLVILTDQQQAGMLNCAGNPWVKTPAMDSLAQTGVRFERAYCVNPVCQPSRTGMFTGYTPSRLGIQSNADKKVHVPTDIQQQAMGSLFRKAGYETAYGGKDHVVGGVVKCGFEKLKLDSSDADTAAACVAFLKQKHDKPFLLVASFVNPHDICYLGFDDSKRAVAASPQRKGKAADEEEGTGAKAAKTNVAAVLQRRDGIPDAEFFAKHCPPLPANFEPQADAPDALGKASKWSAEQWRLHRWVYCRLTEQADREIGRVLQALRDAGLEKNTLVVFTSDHGEMNGAHQARLKSKFFEEAAGVPFIVSLKGVTKPGLVDKQHLVSSGQDLIPTLCDFADIKPPEALLGRSVRALAEGRSAQDWRPYVVSETQGGRMICSGRYKYCVYEQGERREQLVDLEKDPGEMNNLAADPAHADILARHRQYLREWVETNQDKFAAAYLIK
jgi:arylsulfatase A-like enzyme